MITWGKYLAKYHSVKGNFFAFLGFAAAMTIHWGPVAFGVYLIFGKGMILAGILFPVIWWITLSIYFALLPLWWIVGIWKVGFIQSTVSCLIVLGLFSLPDILFSLAERQMIKAEQADEKEKWFEEEEWGSEETALTDQSAGEEQTRPIRLELAPDQDYAEVLIPSDEDSSHDKTDLMERQPGERKAANEDESKPPINIRTGAKMKQEKNIWKEFEGKTNTDEVLIQKARMLAPILVYTAVEDTKLLFEKLKEDEPHRVSEDKFDDVCLEIILFNIHLSDRFAFMCLASKKRNTFIDNLFLEVRENLSRECKSGIDAEYFRNTFAETYNIRQLEYGKCEIMLPEKDEGVRDTLSWEFGKKIAGVLGFEMDVFIITYVSSLVVSSAEIFDLPSLFRGSNS